MARWGYMLFAFAALAAWAGAQGPAPEQPLTAADQLRLLKANSTLIDNMVDHGVRLSNANQPRERVMECRKTAQSLANEVQRAADKQEAERIAELTGLFREVVRDALVPALAEALKTVPPESPDAKRLRELRVAVAVDVADLKAAIPTTGKAGENPRVRNALKQLDELLEILK